MLMALVMVVIMAGCGGGGGGSTSSSTTPTTAANINPTVQVTKSSPWSPTSTLTAVIGDTVYTLVKIENIGGTTMTGVTVKAGLPGNMSKVSGSAYVRYDDGSTARIAGKVLGEILGSIAGQPDMPTVATPAKEAGRDTGEAGKNVDLQIDDAIFTDGGAKIPTQIVIPAGGWIWIWYAARIDNANSSSLTINPSISATNADAKSGSVAITVSGGSTTQSCTWEGVTYAHNSTRTLPGCAVASYRCNNGSWEAISGAPTSSCGGTTTGTLILSSNRQVTVTARNTSAGNTYSATTPSGGGQVTMSTSAALGPYAPDPSCPARAGETVVATNATVTSGGTAILYCTYTAASTTTGVIKIHTDIAMTSAGTLNGPNGWSAQFIVNWVGGEALFTNMADGAYSITSCPAGTVPSPLSATITNGSTVVFECDSGPGLGDVQ